MAHHCAIIYQHYLSGTLEGIAIEPFMGQKLCMLLFCSWWCSHETLTTILHLNEGDTCYPFIDEGATL